MNSTPWIVYLVLAGVSLVQAVLLALQAWEHRRYARSCLRDVAGQRPRGRAMILAPCKGAEPRWRRTSAGCCGRITTIMKSPSSSRMPATRPPR